MKTTIDTYRDAILDLDLVVMIKPTIEYIRENYNLSNGDSIVDNFMKDYPALCTVLQDKEKKEIVIVIILNYIPNSWKRKSKFEQTCYVINTIAHECYHAFMDTVDIIEEQLSSKSQEFPAYYMGWLVECVYRTWTKSNGTIQKRKQTEG